MCMHRAATPTAKTCRQRSEQAAFAEAVTCRAPPVRADPASRVAHRTRTAQHVTPDTWHGAATAGLGCRGSTRAASAGGLLSVARRRPDGLPDGLVGSTDHRPSTDTARRPSHKDAACPVAARVAERRRVGVHDPRAIRPRSGGRWLAGWSPCAHANLTGRVALAGGPAGRGRQPACPRLLAIS